MLVQLSDASPHQLQRGFEELKHKAEALLAREPASDTPANFTRFADLRFAGQLFELPVDLGAFGDPLPDTVEIERRFRAAYEAEFGFDLGEAAVQLVNLRLIAVHSFADTAQGVLGAAQGKAVDLKPVRTGVLVNADGSQQPLPVYESTRGIEAAIAGPALVHHSGSTVWVVSGQTARLGADGSVSIANENDG